MKLILLPGLADVHGDEVLAVHLLLDVLVHAVGNVWFVEDLDM